MRALHQLLPIARLEGRAPTHLAAQEINKWR
jgi:hypothetical protein